MSLALIINVAAVITGIIGAIDIFIHEPARRKSVRALAQSGKYDQQQAESLLAEPVYVEYSKFFFPLLIILVLFLSFSESVNFSLVLVIATVVSGLIWLADKLFWESSRKQALKTLHEKQQDIPEVFKAAVSSEPLVVEYSKAFFPIILIIVVLRSFLFEPFKIPSGSMKPTLEIGDFVLVNKFSYGVRLPVIHTKIFDTGSPQRGDVFVFRFPGEPGQKKEEIQQVDYIKRVIGLPGDRIIYQNRELFIEPACKVNKTECLPLQKISNKLIERESYPGPSGIKLDVLEEDLMGVRHQILNLPLRYNFSRDFHGSCMSGRNQWTIPEGHYFAMGDNRQNSQDSRYWCFVPEENLVGKAIAVWMNWNSDNKYYVNFSRIGAIK